MSLPVEWNDTPEEIAPGSKLEILRCGIGSMVPLIVLSDWIAGGEMHYWGGRSFPHTKNGCPACDAKNPSVWKGYLAAWNPKHRSTGILEFTAPCRDCLVQYKLAHGTLRGGVITLKRKGVKPNGALTATITTGPYGLDQLPDAPDIKAHLERIWLAKRSSSDIPYDTGRLVVEDPMTNDELRKRHPDRFSTPGHTTSPVYEATEEQLEMLRRNKAANATAKANGNGRHS